MRFAALFYS